MQILYALPFIAASFVSFSICIAVPRLRRYALAALVAPVVFGVCSICCLLAFMLAFDTQYASFPRVIAIAGPLLAYIGGGVIGAWLAVTAAQFVVQRFRSSGSL